VVHGTPIPNHPNTLQEYQHMPIYSSNSLEFYVYAYLREDGSPYYIGKGKNKRLFSNDGRTFLLPKDRSRIVICESNLTELGAFALERRLIRWYGRKDNGTGILRNRTDGGEGGSGVVCSDETRQKISQSLKGKKISEETRKKLSDANKGKKLSEKTKQKISETHKGKQISEQTKEKMSVAQKKLNKKISDEHKNILSKNRKGKKLSEETKQKLSHSLKGRKFSDEHRQKIADANRRRKKL